MLDLDLCPAEGRPDMYGLGIRLGFYISWISGIIMEYVHEDDLFDIRVVNFLLSAGVTIGLLIQVVNGDLQPIDINICLLLAMGSAVILTPIYIWRVLTCFNQYLDPLRNSQEWQPPIFRVFNLGLLVTNTGVGVWFFTTYLPDHNLDCNQYAFFLVKMRIDDKIYIAFGCVFFIAIVVGCIVSLLVKAGWRWGALMERPRKQIRRIRRAVLTEYRVMGSLGMYALLIAGCELPIQWNHLDVNKFDTICQTLPTIFAAGMMLRVFMFHLVEHVWQGDPEESSSSEDSDPNAVDPENPRDREYMDQWNQYRASRGGSMDSRQSNFSPGARWGNLRWPHYQGRRYRTTADWLRPPSQVHSRASRLSPNAEE